MKKNYWSPTPLRMRKLGDALLGAGTTITTFAIANDNKTVALIACISGALGKFLTNFFTDDPTA